MRTPDSAAAPIITLTTDFGLADSYVAEMKGVILGLNRRATVVDVSHAVRPQRLLQAVFITQAAWPAFPPVTIHIAIVDPGVGTQRRGIAISAGDALFLGPDNGVLSAAIPDEARPPTRKGLSTVPVPARCRSFAITNESLLRQPLSATFHGRDVFAPAAARLSLGMPLEELGEPVDTILAFPPLRAERHRDGSLQAQVVHIDRFGNVITGVRADDLPVGALAVELAGRSVPGPARTYAEIPELAALVGSSGYLEVALPNASAAHLLGVDIGDTVLVRPRS